MGLCHSCTTHYALIQVAAQAEVRPNDDTPRRGQSLRQVMAARQDPDPRTNGHFHHQQHRPARPALSGLVPHPKKRS